MAASQILIASVGDAVDAAVLKSTEKSRITTSGVAAVTAGRQGKRSSKPTRAGLGIMRTTTASTAAVTSSSPTFDGPGDDGDKKKHETGQRNKRVRGKKPATIVGKRSPGASVSRADNEDDDDYNDGGGGGGGGEGADAAAEGVATAEDGDDDDEDGRQVTPTIPAVAASPSGSIPTVDAGDVVCAATRDGGGGERRPIARTTLIDEFVEVPGPIHPVSGFSVMQSGYLPGVSSDRLKLVNMGAIRGPDDHRFSVLSFDQVQRLDEVMNKPIPIHGRGNFPTLEVRLKDFVSVVRTKLEEQGVHVRDIRLNGGAASYVLLSPDDYDPDADADAEADADADVDAASDGAGSEVCYPAYSGGYRSSPAASERRPAVGGGGGTVRGRPHHQAGPARAGTGGVGGGADADVDGDADSSVGDVDSYYNPSPLPSSEVSGRDLTRSPFSLSSQHSTSSSGSSSASSTSGASGSSHPYNDLDLIFAVDLSQQRNFERVKTATLESLLDFFPEQQSDKRDRMSVCSIKEGYVHKLVKVTNGEGGDRWSLISLSRVRGRNVELKFVDSMKRQFQFSVDSFQILLDSLLLFYECAEMPMGPNFYPTVVGESMFGDFERSLAHLQNKLIATHCPEEIRGGGLLKYCNLLVRGYRAADPARIKTLERYMCSRFFIDFPDLGQQRTKLERYLWDHFAEEDDELTPSLRYQYLMTLHSVVDESTVCLMSHERKSTLFLIEELAYIYRPPNEPVYLFPPPRSYHPHHANYHPHHQQHPGNPYNGYYSNANQHHHQPRHNNNSHHHNQQHSKQHRHHHYDTYYHPQQYYYPSGFVFIPNSWMSCP